METDVVIKSNMIEITEEEFLRFKQLDKIDRQIIVQASQLATINLIDDVDEPLRKSIAMLNLLNCHTIWSCCGFDYENQPVHKFHEYGSIFIRIAFDNNAYSLGYNLVNLGLLLPWTVSFYRVGGETEMQLKAPFTHSGHLKMWDNIVCPHYPETGVFAIDNLEKTLLKFKDRFVDEITIEDTNGKYHNNFENWQYPSKNPWIVRKVDYV